MAMKVRCQEWGVMRVYKAHSLCVVAINLLHESILSILFDNGTSHASRDLKCQAGVEIEFIVVVIGGSPAELDRSERRIKRQRKAEAVS